MRRSRVSTIKMAQGAALLAVALSATGARADITLYDKDGWSFYTKGLIATHYQLTIGEGDPASMHGVLVGTPLSPQGSQDTRDNSLIMSRFRSGFVGTQIGFGANRQISETMRVESLMAVSLFDISSNRGQSLPKGVDFREAWAALITSAGTFKFGRMFSIFGSSSAPISLMAWEYGLGHPCLASEPTIACGSVGAGPLYAGFDAQFRYITPRFAGVELQVAVSDPIVGPGYHMAPFPRADGEVNYLRTFGESGKLRLFGQGVFEQLRRVEGTALKKVNVWGVMGTAILDVGGLTLGGGGWTGAGIGTHVIMEATDAANPLAFDSKGDLRLFRGFYGNAAYNFGSASLALGGGTVFIRSTATDIADGSGVSVIKQQSEGHIRFTKRIDTVHLTIEYMRWMSKWYFGEKQNENFMGVGANYVW